MNKILLVFIALCAVPGAVLANEFDVAHVREQGQNMIVIPLDRSFDSKSSQTQNDILFSLQECASSAGLAGDVVPVWSTYDGGMKFIAPRQWQPFFRSIDMRWVAKNINKSLRCR